MLENSIKIKQSESFLKENGEAYEVLDNSVCIGYVWKADGFWWANDKEFDESIEQFKTKGQATRWLIEYCKSNSK